VQVGHRKRRERLRARVLLTYSASRSGRRAGGVDTRGLSFRFQTKCIEFGGASELVSAVTGTNDPGLKHEGLRSGYAVDMLRVRTSWKRDIGYPEWLP
jgi:hypothetical protein